MDAIHYKVKEDHQIVTKAAYVVLEITLDGKKDILGIWIGEHESSKFWLHIQMRKLSAVSFIKSDIVPDMSVIKISNILCQI